jgi:hypothetical protein
LAIRSPQISDNFFSLSAFDLRGKMAQPRGSRQYELMKALSALVLKE